MSKISEVFKKQKALIAFITAGDPSLKKTEEFIYQLEKAGADIVELGIPYSDPLADGPVIQASHLRGLKNGVTLDDVFLLVKRARKKTQVPIVFMLSMNLVEKHGVEKFYQDCEKYEVDGVIVPDLPVEENRLRQPVLRERKELSSERVIEDASSSIVDRIFMVAPTTKDERIKMIADASSGFIYLVSAMGVTGKRNKLDVSGLVQNVKKYTDKPIAVGFGISDPKQAKEIAKSADGVIVGSAIVDLIGKKQFKKAIGLVASLRKALNA